MFCNKCGTELQDGSRFCSHCGNQFENAFTPQAMDDDIGKTMGIVSNGVPTENIGQTGVIDNSGQQYGQPQDQQGQYTQQYEQPQYQQPQYDQQYGQPQYQQQYGQQYGQQQYQQQYQPVQYQPVPYQAPVENKVKEKAPKPKKVKVKKPETGTGWKVALTVIFAILLTIAGLGMMIQYSAEKNLNKESFESMVDDMDLSKVTINDGYNEVPILEYIEDNYDFSFEEEFGMDTKEVKKLLNKPVTKDLVNELLSGYADYLVGGNKPEAITRETIVDFVKDNKKKIYRDYKGYIKEGSLDNFEEEHGEAIDELLQNMGAEDEELDVSWIKQESGVDISKISKIVSTLKWILLITVIALAVLLIIINLSKISRGITGIAVPALFAGVIALSFSISMMILYNPGEEDMIKQFITPMLKTFLILGGIVLGAGILLLVMVGVGKKISNKKESV